MTLGDSPSAGYETAPRLIRAAREALPEMEVEAVLMASTELAEAVANKGIDLAISRRDNAIEKVVISDSLTTEDTGPWSNTTRIVSRADAHAAGAALKDGAGGDILVFASRTMWTDLLAADLVDEVHLVDGGVVLGGGTPAFSAGTTATLKPLHTQTLEGSDNTVLRYAVAMG